MNYSNSSTCAMTPSCSEYNYTSTNIPAYTGSFSAYNGMGFVVDFDYHLN